MTFKFSQLVQFESGIRSAMTTRVWRHWIIAIGGCWEGEASIVAAVCGMCTEDLSIKYRLLRTKEGRQIRFRSWLANPDILEIVF
ncbi:uncharacterized protein BO87DRAFT_202730 [Aspergillus neoniger CBS 115656]|uniref:Uncharacterized protein n=2 Tax=Aspergillus subgen. Circumdati TaxID=2720871 RepID=A0A318YU59_ASPNB|nr:hypothetical protein BO87DRAFT_202730 [Aspergillus neoniger CBS 115656]XP_025545403.1 hypothetical protein BO79DRAFT_3832 [Aspergillus costaricaensis CBS 115574]PYH28842.1 hypothetical protein BO87DRAFT_202730 [Aspergillus neoniger CBS 115656]RAK94568.1 hypothetical protein BO79DRAFT_3832 [Aspergillus costaricaensis CBS 115574]